MATKRNQIDSVYTKAVSDQILNAYRRAYNQIIKLPIESLTVDNMMEIIDKEYNQSAVANSDLLYSMSKDQYSSAIRSIQSQIRNTVNNYKYSYDRIDRDQLNILDQNNTLFIGKYFSEQAADRLQEELANIIVEQNTKAKATERIASLMQLEGKKAYSYSKMIVETNGTWSRSVAKTTALEDAGFTEYTYLVTEDDVTSDICQSLAGKTNTVQNALRTRDSFLNMDTTNYDRAKAEFDRFSPMITGNEDDGFSAAGRNYTSDEIMNIPGIALPPFHYNCRTEIAVFK